MTRVTTSPSCCQLSACPFLRASTQAVSSLKDQATVRPVRGKGLGAKPAFCSSYQVEVGVPVICRRSGSRTNARPPRRRGTPPRTPASHTRLSAGYAAHHGGGHTRLCGHGGSPRDAGAAGGGGGIFSPPKRSPASRGGAAPPPAARTLSKRTFPGQPSPHAPPRHPPRPPPPPPPAPP